MIATLFQYGATTPDDARMMSNSLIGFALGLLGLVMVKILAPGFFARQNTRTPVKVGVMCDGGEHGGGHCLVFPAQACGPGHRHVHCGVGERRIVVQTVAAESIYEPQRGWLPLFLKVAAAGLIHGGGSLLVCG